MVRTAFFVALLLGALLASSCDVSRSASHETTTEQGETLGELKRFDRFGIRFKYAASWFVTTRPISAAADPDFRFTVSTVRVRRTRADRGPCTPGIGKQLPPGGALAYLREVLKPRRRAIELRRVPARPWRFPRPTTSGALCGFEPGSKGVWFPFKAKGRVFYLAVSVGPEVTAATQRALYRMLDGMRFDSADPS